MESQGVSENPYYRVVTQYNHNFQYQGTTKKFLEQREQMGKMARLP